MATWRACALASRSGALAARTASMPSAKTGQALACAPSRAPCAAATSDTWPVNSTSAGWAWSRILSISRADRRALTWIGQACSRLLANSVTTISLQFSPTTMTRSPSPTPCATSQSRAASMRCHSSP
ncbi:hypothetical protein D3C72_1638250 [compost metagenome]